MRASERLNAMIRKIPRVNWRTVRVYDWERKHVYPVLGKQCSLQRFEMHVGDATHQLGIKPAKVTYDKHRKHAVCRFFYREILVGPDNLNEATAYHEASHLVSRTHGDKWFETYLRLLVDLGGMDEHHLRQSYEKAVRSS